MAACGEDPGPTGVAQDALEDFCDRRCEFQATCVPELRPIIVECQRQCRTSFDNPDLFTSDCREPSLTVRGDPVGPYTVDSVVEYQECLITAGCEAATGTCEETRMYCLDGVGREERCQREARRGYNQCSENYQRCTEQMRPSCNTDLNRCYNNVSATQQNCLG